MPTDGLKNLAPGLQSMSARTCDFSRTLRKLQIIAKGSDWFIALFASVVIGWSGYFGVSFFDSTSP